jgi:hypothetical protein
MKEILPHCHNFYSVALRRHVFPLRSRCYIVEQSDCVNTQASRAAPPFEIASVAVEFESVNFGFAWYQVVSARRIQAYELNLDPSC